MQLDGCVEVEAAYYGTPPGWIGRVVKVQWNSLYVRLLDPKIGQPAARACPPKMRLVSGWCNGSAGHVHLWTAACRRFPDDRFLQMAEGAAWNVWETPGSVPNLCCGLAGQAYALLNFYQLSRQPKWLSMAEQITARAIDLYKNRRPSNDPVQELSLRDESLYKGRLGVAVLAAEIEHPDEAAMPFFSLQRWHH